MEIGGKKTFINFAELRESLKRTVGEANALETRYLFKIGDNQYTTMAVGEEGGENFFEQPGELFEIPEDGEEGDISITLSLNEGGESPAPGLVITESLNEDGGDFDEPIEIDPISVTTTAVGEEGGFNPNPPINDNPIVIPENPGEIVTTTAVGEEGGFEPIPPINDNPIIIEPERPDNPNPGGMTTMALGEEGGNMEPLPIYIDGPIGPQRPFNPNPGRMTTDAVGEEGGFDPNPPFIGPVRPSRPGDIGITTTAVGEEGGFEPIPPHHGGPFNPEKPVFPGDGGMTTMAMGEEGGDANPFMPETPVIGDNFFEQPVIPTPERSVGGTTTMALGEEGGFSFNIIGKFLNDLIMKNSEKEENIEE